MSGEPLFIVGLRGNPLNCEAYCVIIPSIGQGPGTWIYHDPVPAQCGCTYFRRGDSNADGGIDIGDAVAILNYLYLGVNKVPCEQAGDVNDDGTLDISDAIYALSFLFLGGKPIEPPEECGVDPTGHALPCESYPPCL